jgi:uncharacterized protein
MSKKRVGPSIYRWNSLALLLVVLSLTCGCTVFTDYNRSMAPARRAFGDGDYGRAQSFILSGMKGENGERETSLNPWLELGMAEQAGGNFQGSTSALDKGAGIINGYEKKAVISASDTAAAAGTMIVNEKVEPYRGEDFEKTLVHTFMALNYLMINDWEGARVEVRRAYDRQQEAARNHEKSLDEARSDASRQKSVNASELMRDVDQQYADQQPVASRVANAYQNAFTDFLSAVVYNAQREPNDAYIDLKKAYELRPQAPCLGPILIETASAAGFRDEIPRWEQAFGLKARNVLDEAKRDRAELIVVFENGWAPLKRQITIPIPTPYAIATLAIPKYEFQGGGAADLLVRAGDRTERSAVLGDVEAQAVRSLRDRMTVYVIKMAIRVTARVIAEHELQRRMEKEHGSAGAIGAFLASSVVNVALEQADLRAWTLLPRDVQVARMRMPEGPAQIWLGLEGGSGANQTISMNLTAARPNVILVRSTEGVMTIHTNEALRQDKNVK